MFAMWACVEQRTINAFIWKSFDTYSARRPFKPKRQQIQYLNRCEFRVGKSIHSFIQLEQLQQRHDHNGSDWNEATSIIGHNETCNNQINRVQQKRIYLLCANNADWTAFSFSSLISFDLHVSHFDDVEVDGIEFTASKNFKQLKSINMLYSMIPIESAKQLEILRIWKMNIQMDSVSHFHHAPSFESFIDEIFLRIYFGPSDLFCHSMIFCRTQDTCQKENKPLLRKMHEWCDSNETYTPYCQDARRLWWRFLYYITLVFYWKLLKSNTVRFFCEFCLFCSLWC